MAFSVNSFEATAGSRSGTVYELLGPDNSARAEVWPFLGFNCLRWQILGRNLLYCSPDWSTNPVPTRSGHPILFPFPNRLREGRLNFGGRGYDLPRTESTGQHAIHGFTPRLPWGNITTFAEQDRAGIMAQFQLSREFPESLQYWPGDLTLTVTYSLTATALEVQAEIDNMGGQPVPCGLGYHPYFCLPDLPDCPVDEFLLQVPAMSYYPAGGGIPTGELREPEGDFDFRTSKLVGSQDLDKLYTGLPVHSATADSLVTVAELTHPRSLGRLQIEVSPSFRELLLFTPPHRRALAIEPYTCASDAATLTAQGREVGWMTLPPESTWWSTARYSWIMK